MRKCLQSDKLPYLFFTFVLVISFLIQSWSAVFLSPSLAEVLFLWFSCGIIILYSLLCNKAGFFKLDKRSFFAAFAMTVSYFFSFIIASNTLNTIPLKVLATIIVFAAFYCMFQTLLLWDSSKWVDSTAGSRHLSAKQVVTLLALLLMILLVQYRPYFPHGTSVDTIKQWKQVHGEIPYNTIHAIGHTIFLKLLLSIYDSYMIVIIFQLACIIAIYVYIYDYFYSKGISAFFISFVLGMALIWTSSSCEAYFYPWKDNPSAISLAVVTIITAKYLDSNAISIKSAVALGLALAGCMIFRLNGIIAVIVCGFYYAVSFVKKRFVKQLAAMILAFIIPVLAVDTYSTKVLNALEPDNGYSLQVFGSGIAAVVNNDELTDEELAEIDSVLPVEWMRKKYTDFRSKRSLIWGEDGSERIPEDPDLRFCNNEFILRMGENKKEVILLYLSLIPKHFLTLAKDVLGSTAIVWMQDSLFFVASHAFWAVLFAFLVSKYKLKSRFCLVFLPCLCNTVSIMISTVTNEIRYLLPTFLLAPFFVLYTVLHGNAPSKKE